MIYEKPKNEIFASDAKDGEIVEFPNIKRGWGVTENLGFIPPMEYFNAAFNRVDKSLAYQLQRGVGEWDKDLEYPIGAVVSLNGVVYVAKSQNTNKNPANEATIWDIVATQKWCEAVFALKNELTDGLPIGAYLSYPTQKVIPAGFLIADGRSLKKSEYSELFDVIGYTYGGSGDNFNLPNFADGKFMRGIGGNAAALGVAQDDAIRNITGTLPPYDAGAMPSGGEYGVFKQHSGGGPVVIGAQQTRWYYTFDASRVVPTANENRPLNMSVVVIIKVKNVNTPIAGQIDKTILATETKAGIAKLKNAITAKQEDAAVSEKAVSDAIEANKSIGVDQTWQDVWGQRELNTYYPNTAGRPIMVDFNLESTSGSYIFHIVIDDVVVRKIQSERLYFADAQFIVPAGSKYKIATPENATLKKLGICNNINTASSWAELK